MCGIFGLWSKYGRRQELETMAALTRHRGPDDSGLYYDSSVGLWLGMNRLAIIDLSPGGHQPMASEDGQAVLVFNGEIYNFRELRRDLQGRGHRFRSHSDTEVLLRGYLEWGEAVVERLRGMFAFALWDRDRRELFLARDATGIKPLLYCCLPGEGFAFASEMKAFNGLPEFRFQPDKHAVEQYVEFGYVWDGEHGMVEGVRKLPPGTSLCVREGVPQPVRRWWQPPAVDAARVADRQGLDQAADALFEVLNETVRQHLIADVPVGLLLSGGLDSSVLTALAQRHAGPGVRTFAVGFDPCAVDERGYARTVAEYLGTEHREIVLRPADVLSNFREQAWFYDDLFWDTGFISSLSVYRRCREEGLKVVLVGEGADEIFGGYHNFGMLGGPAAEWLPAPLHRYLFFRQYSGQNYGEGRESFTAQIGELNRAAGGDWFATVRRFELGHQIPNNLNMKVDHASMANSVEARVPFQDRRVVELAAALPRAFFRGPGQNKLLLRHMALRHRLLPQAIIDRPKLGMMMPSQWLTSDAQFLSLAASLVLRPGGWAERMGYAKPLQEFFAGKERKGMRFFRKHLAFGTLAWRLFVLQLWQDAFSEAEIQKRLEVATVR